MIRLALNMPPDAGLTGEGGTAGYAFLQHLIC